MLSIPNELHGRAFTRSQALAAGLTPGQLRGPAVVRLTRGVYRTAQTPETIDLMASAGLAELPKDAAVSHLSNLRLRGLDLGPLRPVHFVTANKCQRIRDGFVIHRFAVPPGRKSSEGFVQSSRIGQSSTARRCSGGAHCSSSVTGWSRNS